MHVTDNDTLVGQISDKENVREDGATKRSNKY